MTSAKHKNLPAKPKEKYSVQQALTNYYLLVMFTLFPLFFTDAYFNIRHDKYYFFIILTGILVIAEFLIIMTASVDKPPEDSKLEKPKPKHLYEELSFMDWAFIVFFVFDSFVSATAGLRMDKRDAGRAPNNVYEQFLDNHFPDERMNEIYANSQKVTK